MTALHRSQWSFFLGAQFTDDAAANEELLHSYGVATVSFTADETMAWEQAMVSLAKPPREEASRVEFLERLRKSNKLRVRISPYLGEDDEEADEEADDEDDEEADEEDDDEDAEDDEEAAASAPATLLALGCASFLEVLETFTTDRSRSEVSVCQAALRRYLDGKQTGAAESRNLLLLTLVLQAQQGKIQIGSIFQKLYGQNYQVSSREWEPSLPETFEEYRATQSSLDSPEYMARVRSGYLTMSQKAEREQIKKDVAAYRAVYEQGAAVREAKYRRNWEDKQRKLEERRQSRARERALVLLKNQKFSAVTRLLYLVDYDFSSLVEIQGGDAAFRFPYLKFLVEARETCVPGLVDMVLTGIPRSQLISSFTAVSDEVDQHKDSVYNS
jgi:hypothetical protein